MLKWLRSLLAGGPDKPLRAVPGTGTYHDKSGKVVYNMLDPTMQQFLGRCVGAIKKAGIKAKGTGQFSILLGEPQSGELILDRYWKEYLKTQNPAVFESIVAEARKLSGA